MASLLDGFKSLPSEIRYDILAKIFDDVGQPGNGIPPILPALRGETNLYFEALAEYYSLTTIKLTYENLPAFLALSQPTKDLIRKMCLDTRLDEAIYYPQSPQPSPPIQVLEAASKAHNLEEIHLIPRLCMDTNSDNQTQFPTPALPQPAGTNFTDLVGYLSLLSRGEISRGGTFDFKHTEKHVREILSDFYDAKLRIVQKTLSDFPSLKRLVVEPRLEGFMYFPDSFVGAVNQWLGPGRLMRVGTERRGDGEQWVWDLRGRRRIVKYEE